MSSTVYFCGKCSQFWGCCPSFYGKYQVSIRHFAARWNYLLGNLVRLEFPRWGRNSCSLLSANFELWRPRLSKVKSRKSRLRCNPKLLTKGLPLKSWQQLLHFFQHQYTSSCTFTYFYLQNMIFSIYYFHFWVKSWKSEALFYAFEIFSRAERRSGSEKRERQKYDFSSNSFPQILRNCIKVPQANPLHFLPIASSDYHFHSSATGGS